MSLLKPNESMVGALALGAFVVGTYSVALPHAVDIRAAGENDDHVYGAEKTAAWISAGAVAGLSLLMRDPTMFVTGSVAVIALSWWYRHSNALNPSTSRIGNIMPSYNMSSVAPDYVGNVAGA